MKFIWTTINVKNLDRSLDFYQEIIGLSLHRRIKINDNFELAFLGKGETKIELKFDKNEQNIDFGKDISLGFMVDSLEQFTKILKAKGINIHSGPFQPNESIKFLFVLDPNGLKIQIIEDIKYPK